MNWLNYLLQINLYLTISVAFYLLVLRKETFFQLNRIFLLATSLLAFIIPFWKMGVIQSWFVTEQVSEVIAVISLQEFRITAIQEEQPLWNWNTVVVTLYFLGFGHGMLRFATSLFKLQQLLTIQHIEGQAFSIFGKVFVDKKLPDYLTIKSHEEVHSRQFHSIDIFWFELICTVCWFNPIAHLLKKEVKLIHELIADQHASKTAGKVQYAELLVASHFRTNSNNLVNNFHTHSILKTRIKKLAQAKSKNIALTKYAFVMPVFLAMLVFSAACNDENKQTNNEEEQTLFNNVTQESTIDILETVYDELPPPPPPEVRSVAKPYEVEVIGYGSEASDSKNEVFTAVEDMPEYPGGTQEMYRFINKNIKYPDAARRAYVEGRVFVQFIVKKDGKVGDITILKGIGFGADEEAIRVVKNMPTWKPGKQNGKPVDVYFNMPINFTLSPNNNSISLRNSLGSETSPLIIVIDENGQEKEVMDIKSIPADNILKVEVLKNEHATHAYGEKGKNGVIKITLD
jgi:TonB family protein